MYLLTTPAHLLLQVDKYPSHPKPRYNCILLNSLSDGPKLTCGDMIFQVFLKQKTSGASAPPVLAFFSLSTKQTVRQECRGQRPLTLKTACNKEQEYACISLRPLSGGIGLILQLLLDKTF